MKTMETLIAECPYPIYTDVGLSHPFYTAHCGGYFGKDPPYKVVIMAGHTDAEQYAFLVHEVQHAKCHKNNCSCQCTNSEYHAFMAGLKACFGYAEALVCTTRIISECADAQLGHGGHTIAAVEVTKTRMWKKALKLTKRKNYAMR